MQRPRSNRAGLAHRLDETPIFLWLSALFSLLMLVPAAHALSGDDFHTARAFFYPAVLGLFLAVLMGLALANRPAGPVIRSHLLSLFAAFSALPLLLALPVYEALRTTSYLNAWLDMVSAITTTGAPVFDSARLNDSLHLWRSLVAWMGGLIIWVAAAAILAPLSLGGFEVTTVGHAASLPDDSKRNAQRAELRRRLQNTSRVLVPSYLGLTLICVMGLLTAGETQLVAVSHAMALMSTSGITPLQSMAESQAGRWGEAVLLFFFIFGITRLSFSNDTTRDMRPPLRYDPEIQIAFVATLTVVVLVFFRHWVGALDLGGSDSWEEALAALWGILFTTLSFLTTTGFESADWADAQAWSGLSAPGLLLIALALMGGGVATTAGGIKLLRVYALYQHGLAEMQKLTHPSSIPRPLRNSPRVRREGVYLAWLFFMLFALSIALVMLALTAFGTPFHEALLLAVAGLTTTGPLIAANGDFTLLTEISEPARMVMALAMILGRMEALALLALFNPSLWRR